MDARGRTLSHGPPTERPRGSRYILRVVRKILSFEDVTGGERADGYLVKQRDDKRHVERLFGLNEFQASPLGLETG